MQNGPASRSSHLIFRRAFIENSVSPFSFAVAPDNISSPAEVLKKHDGVTELCRGNASRMKIVGSGVKAMRAVASLLCCFACWTISCSAQEMRRATIWDLKLGEPISTQPAPSEYRNFACGSNGGAPRQSLTGWSDFPRCSVEPNGWHEVYFQYDDEYEYIARARDLEREISRWAGTTEMGFPVVVSGLFDDNGILRGVRLVTDARPDYANAVSEADLRKRPAAYLFGTFMAARYDIDAAKDCKFLPPTTGESAVGSEFVKSVCEKRDEKHGYQIVIQTRFFRKPGQSGVNPQLPTQLTQGQFESSARLEIIAAP